MWWIQIPYSAVMLYSMALIPVVNRYYLYLRFGNPCHPRNLIDERVKNLHRYEILRSGDPDQPLGIEYISDTVPEFNLIDRKL